MLARVQPLLVAETSSQERLQSLIRSDYERCRPDDTFDDLKRRARFSKEDKFLLRDWMKVAALRDREQRAQPADITIAAAA